jgi:hypothetical protein
MMSSARLVLYSTVIAIGLVAWAAWLLNVPPLAIGVGVIVSLLMLFLWLSRHGSTGKRSGVRVPDDNSRTQ